MARLLVLNKLPEETFPTEIFPNTLVAVMFALMTAPLAFVLLIVILRYVIALTPIGMVWETALPLKLTVLVVPGVKVPKLPDSVKFPVRFSVPAPLKTIEFCAAASPVYRRSPLTVRLPVEMVIVFTLPVLVELAV